MGGAAGSARGRPRRRSGRCAPDASAIVLDSAEPSFAFDREGHVVGAERRQQTESHRLIEHLMIAANEQVAGFLEEHRIPALYRVHERPELDGGGAADRPAGVAGGPDAARAVGSR